MDIKIDGNIQDFLNNVTPKLEEEASIHSLMLSLAARYHESGRSATLLVRGINRDESLLIAGLQTEIDRPLIISKSSKDEAQLFAQELAKQLPALPGVNGPSPEVDEFAKTWCSIKQRPSKLAMNFRLYELKKVIEPKAPPGFPRLAHKEERETICRWLQALHDEAIPHDPRKKDEEVYREIDDAIKKEQLFVWDDGKAIVCLVGSMRQTPTERWITSVYTPPDLRGYGFASALVADVSRRIVNLKKKAMLFTDLSNPTSNSIYQKIGYRPLADFKHFIFV